MSNRYEKLLAPDLDNDKKALEIHKKCAAGGRNKAQKDLVKLDEKKSLGNNILLMQLPSIDTDDANQVMERTIEYFTICKEQEMKPTLAGYSLSLGVERSTLNAWKTDKRNKPRSVKQVIDKAYSLIAACAESDMMEGKVNPISAIFLMRNNLGYSNNDVPLGAVADNGEKTKEEIMDKYKYLEDEK